MVWSSDQAPTNTHNTHTRASPPTNLPMANNNNNKNGAPAKVLLPGQSALAAAPKGLLVKLANLMGVGREVSTLPSKAKVRSEIALHIRQSPGKFTDHVVHSMLVQVGYREEEGSIGSI